MADRYVRYFEDDSPMHLEFQINEWAKENNCQLISVSVVVNGYDYVAFVVIEDKEMDSYGKQ